MNVVLSIKPEYVAEIKAGRKSFEFRKTIFRQKVKKVYIYASSPVRKTQGDRNFYTRFYVPEKCV